MLGIEDPWILLAYLLCFISALLCVVYGIVNWNKGGVKEPDEIKEESHWEEKETEMEESL